MTKKDQNLVMHEELCAQRYKNLEDKIDSVISIQKKQTEQIHRLTNLTSFGKGFWKAILIMGSITFGLITILASLRRIFTGL